MHTDSVPCVVHSGTAGLSYAPPTVPGSTNGAQPIRNGTAAAEPYSKAAPTATVTAPRPQSVIVSKPSTTPAEKSLFSMEEDEMTSDQIQCRWGAVGGSGSVCNMVWRC